MNKVISSFFKVFLLVVSMATPIITNAQGPPPPPGGGNVAIDSMGLAVLLFGAALTVRKFIISGDGKSVE